MKAQLIITLEDNGSVTVSGPLADQLLAYGMLESARDCIQTFNAQQALRQAMARQNTSGIVVPKLAVPRDLKGS